MTRVAIAIVPTLTSYRGDVVNEGQFICALAEYIDEMYIVSFEGLKRFVKGDYKKIIEKYIKTCTNFKKVKILILPIPELRIWMARTYILLFYMLLLGVLLFTIGIYKKIDLIYVRGSMLGAPLTLMEKLRQRLVVKIPAIFEEEMQHSTDILFSKSLMISIDKLVIKKSKAIAVPSINFAERLFSKRGVKAHKVIEVPPGIDLYKIKSIVAKCPRKTFDGKSITLGFLGFLASWQGVEMLPEIALQLKKKGYDVKLMVIGDGPLRELLYIKSRDLKIPICITGFLDHYEALCLARKSFDVLVLPRPQTQNTSTIVPLKVLEAICLEIPVVVTDLPCYKALSGKGVYLPKRTPEEFSQAILKAIFELNTNKIDVGKEFIARKYSYKNIARKLLEELKSK